MESRNRARIMSSAITFFGSSANLIIISIQALVMTPLYLRNFELNQYGAWIGTGDILLWLQAMDFGISNFAIQKMSAAHGRNDRRDIMAWFSSSLLILVFLGVLASIVAYILSFFIFRPFILSDAQLLELASAFRLAGLSLGLTLINFAFAGLARALQEPWLINGFTVAGSLVGFLASYVLLINGSGINAIAYGMLSRSIVVLIGGIIFMAWIFKVFIDISKLPNRAYLMESWRISPFSTLGSLGYSMSNQSENLIISYSLSPEIAALYNTMKKFGDMARSLLEALIFSIFAPFSSEYAEDKKTASRTYNKILKIHSALALIFCFLLAIINEKLLTWWVGDQIYLGHSINILLSLQIYFTTRSYLLNSLYRAMGPPKPAYVALLVEAFLKIILVFSLIKSVSIIIIPIVASLIAILSILYFSILNTRLLKYDSQS